MDGPHGVLSDLIRHDQEHKDKIVHMQSLVKEALESGVSDKSMDDILKKRAVFQGFHK